MALHKVSNQRSYKKICIIIHHGNLPKMQICLYISKTCLEHHLLAYDQNRLSFYTYKSIFDHSTCCKLLYLAFSQNHYMSYTTFGYSTNDIFETVSNSYQFRLFTQTQRRSATLSVHFKDHHQGDIKVYHYTIDCPLILS